MAKSVGTVHEAASLKSETAIFFLINEFTTTATATTTIDQQTVLLWDTNLKKYSNVKH